MAGFQFNVVSESAQSCTYVYGQNVSLVGLNCPATVDHFHATADLYALDEFDQSAYE